MRGRIGSRAWRALISPLTWLGPQAARSGAGIERRTQILLTLAVLAANATGAILVFVFANWIVPTPDLRDEGEVRLANAIAFVAYVSITMVIGVVWGYKRMRVLRRFLREEREPTPEERRLVLRGPLRLALVHAVLWGLAVVVFAALNATFSLELAERVALTVAIGGVTTTAVTYLFAERLLRAAAARALASEAPTRPVVPGVAARGLLAWTLGTAVPVLTLMLAAGSALIEDDLSRDQLATLVLALGGLALITGLLIIVLAARATSDPIRSARDALARVEKGDLDAEIPVYDGSEVGLLQAGFNRMVAGLRERERIREAFGTYLDRDVAEHILREGPSLEGEEIEVTLMFLDVRDFTGFAERAPASEVVSTLNRLFELAVPIIQSHQGHVDKFVGDGLLAVFGAPRRDPEHAEQALAAALEITTAVERELGGELEIGIGLNSGPVVAGNVGGAGRLEFSVIGDAVNVAARVESATRETGDPILLSENTASLLGDGGHQLEPRGEVELKGKREPVALYSPKAASRAAAGPS